MNKNFLNIVIIIGALLLEVMIIPLFDLAGICRLLAYSITTGFLILFIILALVFNRGKTSRNLMIRMILNIKGEAGSWYGVFSVIFVLLNLNWLSVKLYEIWNLDILDQNYFNLLIICVLQSIYFLSFTFLTFLFPLFKSTKIIHYEKLLVCGLSTPVNIPKNVITDAKKNKFLVKELRGFYKAEETKNYYVQLTSNKSTRWGKWDIVRKSLKAHPSITNLLIVISPEIKEFERLRKGWIGSINEDLCHDFDIELLIKKFFPNRTIHVDYTPPIDVNNFDLVKNTLKATLQLLQFCNYADSEIVFNLTGSTAIVSSAMVLFAMKGDRKAEYVHQTTGSLIPINVDVFSVQDLWDEIIFKVQEKYSKS